MKQPIGRAAALRSKFLRALQWMLSVGVLATLGISWLHRAEAGPNDGPGGPILLITSGANFGHYYAEILRTEGLNEFAVADASAINATTLAAYDVVVLAKMPVTSTQLNVLTDWVNAGGNLIAMAPDASLAPLLGLAAGSGQLSNAYLRVDTSRSPGAGIVSQPMQFHGAADRYTLNGAIAVATLYSDPGTPTSNPAVTLRSVGAGNAAAFTFDLATSVVQTRQGNPAWATQERDGFSPIRSDDKFFGAAAGDPQPDWVDLSRVAIPQADEQQRLFANLILHMNLSKKPLPRFWYFPGGKKAVVVMTGDDHGNGGTAARFDRFKALSPAGCSVNDWQCVRGTSYIYPNTPLTNEQAAAYAAEGFEVGLHISTWCADFTRTSLESTYAAQVAEWRAKYSSVPALATQRHHCIVWSDWSSGATVQLSHGMRLDTSYYYWPPGWVNNVPGLFTGSAMPMRFAALDGALIDVYQVATQMTDESSQSYPFTIDTLLDRAIGPEGYFGAYTINAHTDVAASSEAEAVVASAQARGVPVVSARQLLTWLDARNASAFAGLSWSGGSLSFTIAPGINANGLQAMVPVRSSVGVLGSLTRGGTAVNYSVQVIKGVEYAMFAAQAGSYVAGYAADTTAPTIVAVTPAPGATGVSNTANITATFSEAMDPASISTNTFQLRDAANTLVPASVSYDAATFTATLTPGAALATSAQYTATIRGGSTEPRAKDVSGQPVTTFNWSFTTSGSSFGCPCSSWPASTVPSVASHNDPNPVELGVKFRADVNGFITGVRFYKGTGNTGSHLGSVWTTGGQRLASATFINETASGWQQVNFSTPVAINANTVYIVSYFAPNGGYAADLEYFATSGVDRAPIHLLRDGESGGNGVYTYSSTSTFPTSTYRSANYWVDVVFTTSANAPPDTTPPTVTSRSPASGATNVSTSAPVTATFSEAMDPASINANTFQLRNAANAVVTATVTYDAATRTATLTPGAALAASASYTATLQGGSTDPRVRDAAGNALAATESWSFTTAAPGGVCASPANPIVAENCLTGHPASEWDISGVGDTSIQGYATQISVNRGTTVSFKVNTPASNYRFDIYRLGYYGGLGARRVATVQPTASLPQSQPACLTNATTGLIDCGNWAVSGSWAVPANATSGIYVAKLVRADTGGASHIVFIVRDDASRSQLLFQTSDTTWQAYNSYGGASLYTGGPVGRAYKVSYNRPFNTRAVDNGQDWLFSAEYPMVRWLEANGYDVTYTTGVDSDRIGNLIANHRVFLSVGHDEYWSGAQRANVEAARNAGVHLAFFSGNEVFWKTRWENSIDSSATPYRTLVSYKETHANAKIDPEPVWTGTWRDPRFSPPYDGGRPENALTGTLFIVNDGATTAIRVPAEDGRMRFWRNTSIATLSAGQTATLANSTLGYEWDVDADNGFRPPGLFRLSTTTVSNAPVLQDFGSTYSSGTATHSLTMYRHSSGALVFGAGTVQWAWGLDATHDRTAVAVDPRMQQATVNLFADMGSQPATLQPGLVPATASTDSTVPTSTITSPTAGGSVALNTTVTITGTAADTGGVVGGVEVSTDNGATWHPATGRATWSYSWRTPGTNTTATIRTRAVDDSGNIETPSAGVTVNVGSGTDTTPPTVTATSPASGATGVSGTANVTATFSEAMTASTITTSTFELRDAAGNLVPAVVSYNATSRVATLNPSVTLVQAASYTAVVKGGASGVRDAAGNAMAADRTWSFTIAADVVAPTITSVAPAEGASGVSRGVNVRANFSEAMNPATINTSTFQLVDTVTGTTVPAAVTYDATNRRAILNPNASLQALRTYRATVRGGASGVRDTAGNALAADRTWTFTTR